jgi:HSP20 family molecular chaperone IbpA
MTTLPRVLRTAACTPGATDVDRAFAQIFGRDLFANEPNTAYAVDIREDQSHVYIDAELPGFTKDQVEVTVEDHTLTISASRETATETPAGDKSIDDKTTFLRRERTVSRYQRSFSLPPTIDDTTVAAKLDHGILTVTLNKRDEVKPRKITVA